MNYKEILDKIESVLKGEAHLDELAKQKRDPFKILISTILSARTKDTNTRAVTEKLFAKYNTPQLIADADLEDLEELIKSSGFYKVKAARIKEVSKIIHEQYDNIVPKGFKELINLPGVGSKTANCVLVYAFQIPAIPVDTHVHRISNRLGWVKTNKPESTEKELKKIIPKELWLKLNRLFVKFGQEICVPINPKHNICPIENFCPKDFSMEQERKERKRKK
ncbi:MAG: endonuclease III domain-containing protein [Promethearchaeota archaeon]